MNEREILDKLIKLGKITEEDVIEADCRIVNAKKANLVDTLHIVYCTLNHDNGECDWYKEEQADYPWGEPFHQEWLKLFNIFLASTKNIKLIEPISDNID